MTALKIADLIPDLTNNLLAYKVHMAIGTTIDNNPLHVFLRGEFKKWQEEQTKKNFERPYILSLIHQQGNDWLFAGIYKSNGSTYNDAIQCYVYDTELVPIREDLIGRLVIRFVKNFRASYLVLENHHHELYVSEILKEPLSIQPFPGYEKVNVDYLTLKTIIRNEDVSWFTALKSIKGIYLITDKTNGKLYVGSVCGEEAFWTRWSEYVNLGHGKNMGLMQLLTDNGEAHVENFTFSILEVRSAITTDREIIQRENHWKKVLRSREFGYNKN